jgi:hypothetical protein
MKMSTAAKMNTESFDSTSMAGSRLDCGARSTAI